MGGTVGVPDGLIEGSRLGLMLLGFAEGDKVGVPLGAKDGVLLGVKEGTKLGVSDGVREGFPVGALVGPPSVEYELIKFKIIIFLNLIRGT